VQQDVTKAVRFRRRVAKSRLRLGRDQEITGEGAGGAERQRGGTRDRINRIDLIQEKRSVLSG
jgi:hypothetical protein